MNATPLFLSLALALTSTFARAEEPWAAWPGYAPPAHYQSPVFKSVTRPAPFGSGLQDPDGKVWSPVIGRLSNCPTGPAAEDNIVRDGEAALACKKMGGHLPTAAEYIRLGSFFGMGSDGYGISLEGYRDLTSTFPGIGDSWTGSYHDASSADPEQKVEYCIRLQVWNSPTSVGYDTRCAEQLDVRCVAGAEKPLPKPDNAHPGAWSLDFKVNDKTDFVEIRHNPETYWLSQVIWTWQTKGLKNLVWYLIRPEESLEPGQTNLNTSSTPVVGLPPNMIYSWATNEYSPRGKGNKTPDKAGYTYIYGMAGTDAAGVIHTAQVKVRIIPSR